jgi:rubrerythrin
MNQEQLTELLYQALETEQGGQRVYEQAIKCAQTPQLKEEWDKYLAETTEHERILRTTFDRLKLDPEKETPGRQVVRKKADALVAAMQLAASASPVSGELCAAESVVEAETKDHQNWELIGMLSEELKGDQARALAEAYAQVEEQEDEHLYHTMGWARELWLKSLGMPAVIPPPEEEKKVKTAIGAARARQSREEMLSR